jgi:hypothetical protein
VLGVGVSAVVGTNGMVVLGGCAMRWRRGDGDILRMDSLM